MRENVFFKGEILPASLSKMSAFSSAALYGRGIFTTVAVYDKKPFLVDLHERRLRENAAKINLDLSNFSFENLRNSLCEIISANKIGMGRARITVFDSRSSSLWRFENENKIETLITVAENQPKNEINLTISPFLINSTSPLAGVKSCNYLENLLAIENARKLGFSEAVRLNERGKIVSAVMANIFLVLDDKIYTPKLDSGALAGTTRELTIKLAENFGTAILQTDISTDDLNNFDEVFLTSAGLEIGSVQSINGRFLRKDLTQQLQELFFDFVKSGELF